MPSIVLPSTVPLSSSQPMSYAARDGQLVPQGDIHYPAFYLDTLNPVIAEAFNRWREDNAEEYNRLFNRPRSMGYAERMPFHLSPSGLEFDPAWSAFAPLAPQAKASLSGSERLSKERAKRVVDMFSSADLPWDMRCLSIRPHTSLVGMCMHAVGKSNGALPGVEMDLEIMPPSLILKGLKKSAIPIQKLREFTDGGLTLLDLATRYQCWNVAQWLWKKGVRFGPAAIESGHVLLDLGVAYESCAKAVRGFASPDYILHTRLPASQWFKQWFDRWEQSGGHVPAEPQLDWAARVLIARGFNPPGDGPHPLITPQQMFASRAIVMASNNTAVPLDRADPECIASLRAWVEMFCRHGVDILHLDFSPVSSGSQPMTMAMRLDNAVGNRGWKEMISAQISQAGLKASTSTLSGQAKPSLRF